MTEEELIRQARKRRPGLSDPAVRFLKEGEYIQDALGKDFDEDQLKEIIAAIDYFKAVWGGSTGGGNGSRKNEGGAEGVIYRDGPSPRLTEVERERGLLLLETQLRVAATDPRVTVWRQRYLPDGLLNGDEAEVLEESFEFSELDSLAVYLHNLHGWSEKDAARWILTGVSPIMRPVRVSYRAAWSQHSPGLSLVVIEAPPWISAATFREAFVQWQQRTGVERKPPKARSVKVVRFVESLRADSPDNSLTFVEMWRRWNEKYPDERFSEARTFERAYQRTAAILRRRYEPDFGNRRLIR